MVQREKGRLRRIAGRVVRFLGGLVAALALVLAGLAGYVEWAPPRTYPVQDVQFDAHPTPERVKEGARIARMLCAGCHGDPTTGALIGKRMDEVPAAFGDIRSVNITQHPIHGIGRWTDGQIAYLLRTGIRPDGRYAPVMLKFPNLSDEDLASIIAFLRSDDPLVRPVAHAAPRMRPSLLGKAFVRFAMKPLPYPDFPIPGPTDKIALGRYLVTAKFDCIGCHTADGDGDIMAPERAKGFLAGGTELVDAAGQKVWSANLTPDATGLAGWTEQDLSRAVRRNTRPDGRLLRVMPQFAEMRDDEVAAIYAYLRTVPKVAKVRPQPETESVALTSGAGEGQRIYAKYGCQSCHGTSGVGTCDLRPAAHKYTDAQIIAFVKDPARTVSGSRMPSWDGVIEEQEYAALAAYVRALGEGTAPVTTAQR